MSRYIRCLHDSSQNIIMSPRRKSSFAGFPANRRRTATNSIIEHPTLSPNTKQNAILSDAGTMQKSSSTSCFKQSMSSSENESSSADIEGLSPIPRPSSHRLSQALCDANTPQSISSNERSFGTDSPLTHPITKSPIHALKESSKISAGDSLQSLDLDSISLKDSEKSSELLKPSTKQNFAKRFPEVNVPLLQYYSCAWEKDILWQGRIYITDTALCFYSKILFGNEIKETIWMKNIARIEKSSVAGVIPNAITVYTLNPEGRYFFASFLKRDLAFDLIHALWKKGKVEEKDIGSEADAADPTETIPETIASQDSKVSKKHKTQGSKKSVFLMIILCFIFLSIQLLVMMNSESLSRDEIKVVIASAKKSHISLFSQKLEHSLDLQSSIRANLIKIRKGLETV